MTDVNNFQYVREHVREVPDFPKKGILFLDVTTIVKDAKAFNMCIDFLYEKFKDENIDYVAGIESRGFIFGAPLACKLKAGFVTVSTFLLFKISISLSVRWTPWKIPPP